MRISLLIAAVAAATLFVKPAQAAVATSVDWTSATAGDLNGIGVTFPSGESVTPFDLSGPDYSAAPLSALTETTNYDSGADWTATFDQPVSNLLLYPTFWRGSGDTTEVTFNQPFTILSGLVGTSVASNTLTLANGFNNGIIKFTGPISSLSITSSYPQTDSNEALTFAVVPEPTSALLLAGLGAAFCMRRRRQ